MTQSLCKDIYLQQFVCAHTSKHKIIDFVCVWGTHWGWGGGGVKGSRRGGGIKAVSMIRSVGVDENIFGSS